MKRNKQRTHWTITLKDGTSKQMITELCEMERAFGIAKILHRNFVSIR